MSRIFDLFLKAVNEAINESLSPKQEEFYEPEKYYHFKKGTQTLCGREVVTDGEGRWVNGPQLQKDRTPCPICIARRMQDESS